jgi:predicted SnoaL-like aldol condensation-catalyzing enzyme
MASENKRLVRRLFNDLWNKGNLAVATQSSQPPTSNHDPATPDFGTGPEGVKRLVTLFRNAFPDLHFKIDHMIDADDFVTVTTRYTATGTHKGALQVIAPTPTRQSKLRGYSSTAYRVGGLQEAGWFGTRWA